MKSSEKFEFLVINGPNINMLGKRDTALYGPLKLEELIDFTTKKLAKLPVKLDWFQSNIEGEIVTCIQKSLSQSYAGIIINPAAYTHTSVAIRDALEIVKVPIVEVHLSNTNSREDFRKTKLTSSIAKTIIEGPGKFAYYLASLYLIEELNDHATNN